MNKLDFLGWFSKAVKKWRVKSKKKPWSREEEESGVAREEAAVTQTHWRPVYEGGKQRHATQYRMRSQLPQRSEFVSEGLLPSRPGEFEAGPFPVFPSFLISSPFLIFFGILTNYYYNWDALMFMILRLQRASWQNREGSEGRRERKKWAESRPAHAFL